MMSRQSKQNTIFLYLLVAIAGILGLKSFFSSEQSVITETVQSEETTLPFAEDFISNGTTDENAIDRLTREDIVVEYIRQYQKLPDYYITKKEAQQQGWIPSRGNLCEVLPGKAIGGDNFGNREKRLPVKAGRKYFEADLNYNCGRRNADRVVFSNDGLIYVTKDHYNSFELKSTVP